jgi:hypothetical protein
MPDWISSPWLWVVVVAALFALARWVGYLPADPTRPRHETPALCAWCIYRTGDDCTHPKKPSLPRPHR